MKLYFIRHATATDIALNDAARELTEEGRDEAAIAGAALAGLGVDPSAIFTSPLVRARQTAEIVAKGLKHKNKVQTIEELTNDTSTADLICFLKRFEKEKEVALVGHAPSLSIHVAALVGAKNHEGIPLGKGGIACVELDELLAGKGELRWLMRQRQLRAIAG
jgi:phosphohistidine phosphatase